MLLPGKPLNDEDACKVTWVGSNVVPSTVSDSNNANAVTTRALRFNVELTSVGAVVSATYAAAALTTVPVDISNSRNTQTN